MCGPAGAKTLGKSAQARVYVAHGYAFACRRHHHRHRLERARRVRGVEVAGHFGAVRSRAGDGEVLRVYDLRTGRVSTDGGGDRREVRAHRFTAFRVASNGVAAYVGDDVGVIDGGERFDGSSIDRAFIGLAGRTLAWRTKAGTIRFEWLGFSAPDGLLGRFGDIRLDVVDGKLRATLDGHAPRVLGEPRLGCRPSACDGIAEVRFARGAVATYHSRFSLGWGTSWVLVHHLAKGLTRQPCGDVSRWIFTEGARAACVEKVGAGYPHEPRTTYRIRSEGEVLDQGTGIDPESFHRRGDQLVWRHDGVERTAPLP